MLGFGPKAGQIGLEKYLGPRRLQEPTEWGRRGETYNKKLGRRELSMGEEQMRRGTSAIDLAIEYT
jgi:hypothetical protein